MDLEKSSVIPQLIYRGVEWKFETACVRPRPSKKVTGTVEAAQLAGAQSVTLPRLVFTWET